MFPLWLQLEMDQPERRAFVQFTTGCPHLPPTGLAALNPMLSVSLKHCPDGAESELPSASTCFHVLKMPAYTSKEAAKRAARLRDRKLEGPDRHVVACDAPPGGGGG
eukprot:CAMPEP_0180083600 /NCGR_PEP_ID=MMETSP0985-20121206/19421_1 /TAXON_ID=483367 /ORGANISM="non described non described, Strain CCMP 2436" /LENGTH=106 /DNA_ID=CAMNT_0022017219 /DNA_START=619 /DNA_END=934 /DNA_ORIENTATION=-